MKNKRKTLTIGISAFNEGKNISYLLKSIMRQKNSNYDLEKIVIISDGCNDDTVKKVKLFKKQLPQIRLINNSERKGKIYRLMQLYKMNTSDILIILDGDVVLANPNALNSIIVQFKKKNVTVVGGKMQAVTPISLIGKIITTWIEYRNIILSQVNRGNNIHNLHGCIMALRKDFVQSIKFPKEIISESQYIYCSLIKKKFEFQLSKDYIVYFRPANKLSDFLNKSTRALNEKQKLKLIFGDWIYDLYFIPMRIKIKSLIKMFLTKPLLMSGAILFYILKIISPRRKKSKINGIRWEIAQSTKLAIKNIDY